MRYLFYLSLVLSLSGCDTITDTWDWLYSFVTTFLSDLACMAYSFYVAFLQLMINGFVAIMAPLFSVLPNFQMPTVNISDITFLKYAAYFFPITEAAVLIKYLLLFYVSFFTLRIILRWLKVVR